MKDINFYRPELIQLELESGWCRMERQNEGWHYSKNGATVEVVLQKSERGVKVFLSSQKLPVKAVALHWATEFEEDILIYGDAWERGYGDLQWQPICPERNMPWYILIDESAKVSGIGVTTAPKAMISWYADFGRVTFVADTTIGSDGVELGSRVLEIAEIVWEINCEENIHNFAAGFAKRMCENPKRVTAPIYGGNNWYYAYGDSSAERILEEGKFISSLSDNTQNRPFMVIDDCWQQARKENNPIRIGGPWEGNHKFADMEKLAIQLRKSGVKPGIWFRPLLMNEPVKASWLFKENESGYILDPTEPEVIEYVAHETAKMSDWGYELIKQDFSTYDLFGKWGFQARGYRLSAEDTHFKDRRYTSAEMVHRLYEAMARESNMIIGCNTLSHLSAGVFEIMRTGDDTSGRVWERTRRMGINTLAMRMHQHKAFYECDADCVGITDKIDWRYNEQWLDLLANSGTPLFISADPRHTNSEHQKSIKKAFEISAVQQKSAVPLNWQSNTAPSIWDCQHGNKRYSWNAGMSDLTEDIWWR